MVRAKLFLMPDKYEPRPLLAVCCPGSSFPAIWMQHWTNLLPQLLQKYSVVTGQAQGANIWGVRNHCIKVAWDTAAPWIAEGSTMDYVLWIDSDNLLTYGQFLLLEQVLVDHPEAAMVGAWAWVFSPNNAGGAEVSAGWYRGGQDIHVPPEIINSASGLIEVDYVGFAATLMRASAFAELPHPPFRPGFKPDGSMRGEDDGICAELRALGHKIYIHPHVHVPHLKLLALQPAVGKTQ